MNQPTEQPDPAGPGAQRAEAEVARRLTGDMPCVTCRYNLRSLSVLDVCPECGTPVRATVLAVVDPYATVLQPIRRRWPTAAGLVLWSAAALVAALCTWLLRAGDVYSVLASVEVRPGLWVETATLMMALSCVGGLVLIRPHARIPAWQSLAAATGIACGIGAAVVYWQIHGRYDAIHTRPFVEPPIGKEYRTWLRLLSGVLLMGAVLGLRPNARLLASRSLVLRMGRADRQTILAMAGALGAAAVGDLVRLAAFALGEPVAPILNTAGIVLIAMGSILFTVGLWGVLVDCLRIARVIVRPAASIRDVVSEASGAGGRGGGSGGGGA